MKKLKKTILILLFFISLSGLVIYFFQINKNINKFNNNIINNKYNNKIHIKKLVKYNVYLYDKLDSNFDNYDDALKYAKTLKKAYITKNEQKEWIWDNFNNFIVYSKNLYLKDFNNFKKAYDYAKVFKFGIICWKTQNNIVWQRNYIIKDKVKLNVPIINQFPELPRGCEVTSLAMLLNYKNINVNKMELAKKIKKDSTEYKVINNKIYYGNPNKGFVGNMYNLNQMGYGVYHKPIYDLISEYIPDISVDLTGVNFDELYYYIDNGSPVWVITNTLYEKLEDKYFKQWHTDEGVIKANLKEHSVLITGYDKENIYFNDPINRCSSMNKNDFIQSWEQMGKQAITILPISNKVYQK